MSKVIITTTVTGDLTATMEKWIDSCGQDVVKSPSGVEIPNLGISFKKGASDAIIVKWETIEYRFLRIDDLTCEMQFYGEETDYSYGDIRQMMSGLIISPTCRVQHYVEKEITFNN